jgi:hypothetical protein
VRNKSSQLPSIDLWQGCQDNSMRKECPTFHTCLHMWISMCDRMKLDPYIIANEKLSKK